MTTLGIFGGSFNPAHYGHVLCSQWALATGQVDHVLVVPCWEHAFGKNLVSFKQRFEMLKIAFAPFMGIVTVTDIERLLQSKYTIDMVKAVQKVHPTWDLRLILGTDLVSEIDAWKDHKELLEIAPPLWIPRTKENSGFTLPTVSSTVVRLLLSEEMQERLGDEVKEYLNPEVLEYIISNDLYR